MPGEVCIDASLALMWVLEDVLSESAEALAVEWDMSGVILLAPPLFRAEITSVIRERAYRGDLASSRSKQLLRQSFAWPVLIRDPGDALQKRAFELATQFNQPKAYDAQYLALAELLGCELWTGDRRLVNAVGGKAPSLRWVGDYSAV